MLTDRSMDRRPAPTGRGSRPSSSNQRTPSLHLNFGKLLGYGNKCLDVAKKWRGGLVHPILRMLVDAVQ